MKTNIPYIKKYNDKRELLNPITKDKPYLTLLPSAARLRSDSKKSSNNKKGVRMVISGVFKTVISRQLIFKVNKYVKKGRRKIFSHSVLLRKPVVINHAIASK